MSVSDEVNREVVGGVVVTSVPEGKNACQEPFEEKLASLSCKMEMPASGAHVPACLHTDGSMLGRYRMEHVCELKVVIFSFKARDQPQHVLRSLN